MRLCAPLNVVHCFIPLLLYHSLFTLLVVLNASSGEKIQKRRYNMINDIVIAISGKLGVGKDSFADIAVNEYDFVKLSLAGMLKEEVREFLIRYDISFEERNLYGTQADKEELILFPEYFDYGQLVEHYPFLEMKCRDLTFRFLLQLWGTEYRRKQNDNYWIEAFDREASKHKHVVCSDLRFGNEYDYFKSINAYCVRINRGDSFVSSTNNHLSETALDNIQDWDYVLNNNNVTLQEYEFMVRAILKEIVYGRV